MYGQINQVQASATAPKSLLLRHDAVSGMYVVKVVCADGTTITKTMSRMQ
jgi:hypothetical protein